MRDVSNFPEVIRARAEARRQLGLLGSSTDGEGRDVVFDITLIELALPLICRVAQPLGHVRAPTQNEHHDADSDEN